MLNEDITEGIRVIATIPDVGIRKGTLIRPEPDAPYWVLKLVGGQLMRVHALNCVLDPDESLHNSQLENNGLVEWLLEFDETS